MRRLRSHLVTAACMAATAALLVPLVAADIPWPTPARDYLEVFGVTDSGALNLVSAIYLGYRAFDTLGETIVLLVAVSGTIGIIAQAGAVLAQGYDRLDGSPPDAAAVLQRPPRKLRTNLIEVVTGKLGPIVLVFGLYVMLFGHLSPGGGFQGGVVVASGIVFLYLGGRAHASTQLTAPAVLARIEAAAFLLLVAASIAGVFSGGGFFSNVGLHLGAPPVAFIVGLNTIIGLKVGAGIGFMCIALLGKVSE